MSFVENNSDGILLESGTNEVEFIEFYLGDISYGINVSKVQRVLASTTVQINHVAEAHPSVKGVIHIQEKPIMLMDLKEALGIPFDTNQIDRERQLILVANFNGSTTAFVIDGISKIHRTSWEHFQPMDDQLNNDDSAGFSTGTINLDDNIIIILDLERLMLKFFPHAHSKSIDDIEIPDREGRDAIEIVYAEDSSMVRALTEGMLRKSGYTQIASFENGYDALAYIKTKRELAKQEGNPLSDYIDLVLTDIEMPRMDGLTLCRNVKQEEGSIDPPTVIVYSSLINKEMETKCRSVGADAQLAKPELEKIVSLIDDLCLDRKALS